MKKLLILSMILLLSFGCESKNKNDETPDVEEKIEEPVEEKDTEKPVITFKAELSTEAGTKIDLLKDVSVTDNVDEKVDVTVEGEYDFNKAGTYTLYYVAKDSSENEAKEEFKLVVKAKKVDPPKEPVQEPKKPEQNNNNNNNNTEPKVDPPVTNPDGTFTTSKGFHGETKNGITYIDGILIANKTYALPKDYVPSGTYGGLSGKYVEISTTGIVNNAYNAYLEMKNAASAAGYNISIASGYRSYGKQEELYNRYVKNNGKADADLGSARPGHSEHQTGLAFDLNTINQDSANTNTTKWVLSNCYKYGFILRYPSGKTGETGYKYEWWHLRYVGEELATKLYNGGDWITLENYFGITSKYAN